MSRFEIDPKSLMGVYVRDIEMDMPHGYLGAFCG
jgi:hypothetical protein